MNSGFTKTVCRLVLVLMALVIMVPPLWACPNCKTAVADNSSGMALGFAWSIALLLGVPALIIAGWGIALMRLARKFPADPPARRLPHPLPAE